MMAGQISSKIQAQNLQATVSQMPHSGSPAIPVPTGKKQDFKQVTMREGSGQAINFPRTFDSRSSTYLWGRKSDSEKTNEKDGFKSGGEMVGTTIAQV